MKSHFLSKELLLLNLLKMAYTFERSPLSYNYYFYLFVICITFTFKCTVADDNDGGIVLEWAAPFLSGGGYCSEAFAFVSALVSTGFTAKNSLHATQHGDSYNQQFVMNMRGEDSKLLNDLMSKGIGIHSSTDVFKVSICHSEPGAWYVPHPKYHTQPCPSSDANYKIGRTMFETDRIPEGWVSRFATIDELWVPTEASRDAFISSGVKPEKLVVVPEPVDTDLYRPLQYPQQHQQQHSKGVLLNRLSKWKHSPHDPGATDSTFIFLFVGKFEHRKGIHILLRAFYEEFFSKLNPEEGDRYTENVLLCILTSAYHSTSDFFGEIERFLREEDVVQSVSLDTFLSRIILYSDIPQSQMPTLYSIADVLVVPSRGEGWGRPHVEAMSCGTPVIATNWSGPTAYLTRENGFPLKYGDKLVPARGWQGHFWAEPSLAHLKELLRFTFSHPEEVSARGLAARRSMTELYSYQVIGSLVASHLERVADILKKRVKHNTPRAGLHEL